MQNVRMVRSLTDRTFQLRLLDLDAPHGPARGPARRRRGPGAALQASAKSHRRWRSSVWRAMIILTPR